MSLESTMLLLDTSDFMINGDFFPTRLDAQQDSASLIASDRTRGNAESTVGVIAMSGKGVKLLTSPTEDMERIHASLAKVTTNGTHINLITSIQIAQLALKHRKNKNGGQRIIVFIGSPLLETSEKLGKVGKQLKKNNISLDILHFGQLYENNEKLNELLNAVNSNDNSHFVTIPSGISSLDLLRSSPIMQGNLTYGGNMGSNFGEANNEDFDPSLDPELAMAIRVSTEEARAQEAARMSTSQDIAHDHLLSSNAEIEDDEETLMQRALELSMMDTGLSTNDVNVALDNNSNATPVSNVDPSADLGLEEHKATVSQIVLIVSNN